MVKKIETNIEDLRKEKATDDKTDLDFRRDVRPEEPTDIKPAVKGEMKTLADLPGAGDKTVTKIRDAGYTTIEEVATARADEIAAVVGVSFVQAKAWVNYASEALLTVMKAKLATQIDAERKNKIQYIETGSKRFNALIGGGIATGSTTGLSGRFASGKTQICFESLIYCITVLKRKAVYIETEPNTFELKRLKEMADKKHLKNVDWNMIYVCEASQIPTIKAQFLQYRVVQKLVEGVSEEQAKEKGIEKQDPVDIGLVCIDSFNAKIRQGYGRRELLPVRTRELSEHFNLIDYLAAKYNIAWLLTCQVIGAPDPGQGLGIKMKTGDSFYPVGGEYLLHSVQTWVSLQQIKAHVWEAVLYDSSYLPRGSATISLEGSGLMDSVIVKHEEEKTDESKTT